jgi:hypothetical protein
MTTLEAVQVIEDSEELDEEEYVQAFQTLIDSGVVWQLQGFYGREAIKLIQCGACSTGSK